uniref:Uncharacterized protein n=1 Tax=Oryza glumipatula TaxID=40148 RepID=A0A0D9ZI24_9ORYZ
MVGGKVGGMDTRGGKVGGVAPAATRAEARSSAAINDIHRAAHVYSKYDHTVHSKVGRALLAVLAIPLISFQDSYHETKPDDIATDTAIKADKKIVTVAQILQSNVSIEDGA